MRYAYQLLLDSDLVHDDDGEQKLRAFLGDEEFATAIPKGWFCVGKKHDVPRDALYWGSYDDVYVWVMDDQLDGLSRFYLTILRIALLEANQRTAHVTRTYVRTPSGRQLKTTKVRSVEQLPIKNEPTPAAGAGEIRRAGHQACNTYRRPPVSEPGWPRLSAARFRKGEDRQHCGFPTSRCFRNEPIPASRLKSSNKRGATIDIRLTMGLSPVFKEKILRRMSD